MVSNSEIVAYYRGLSEGIRLFAHWKDGVQYVGTTGKTLKRALEEIEQEERQKLKDISYYDKDR